MSLPSYVSYLQLVDVQRFRGVCVILCPYYIVSAAGILDWPLFIPVGRYHRITCLVIVGYSGAQDVTVRPTSLSLRQQLPFTTRRVPCTVVAASSLANNAAQQAAPLLKPDL